MSGAERRRNANSLPSWVLLFSKACSGNKAVLIHGAVTLLGVSPLADQAHCRAIEQQRELLGSELVAFRLADPQKLSQPLRLEGGDVRYCGHTGSSAKSAALVHIMSELGMTGWPRSVARTRRPCIFRPSGPGHVGAEGDSTALGRRHGGRAAVRGFVALVVFRGPSL